MTAGAFPCRDCGQPIIRAHTNNGRATMLDAQPSPEGEVAFLISPTEIEVAVTLRDKMLEKARKAGTKLYTVHFITCPEREGQEAA
jgi:hypothetical protein